ncbi:MAG: helix-hairpin-helix domain-containing protein [Sterolibacterium sp.]|jgi:DNA uptake protein ComE-like DNA-binding protein
MNRTRLFAVLSASLLVCAIGPSFAAGNAHDAADDSTTMRKAKEASHKPNPKTEAKMKEAAKIKLVDLNGATSEELKTLPGIGDAEAAKIIAGRPYGSKAHLVSRNIMTSEMYENLKKQVIAKQPNKDASKNAELYAPKKGEPKK